MDQRLTELETDEVGWRVDIPRRKMSAGSETVWEDEQIETEARQLRNLLAVYVKSV